MTFITCPRDVTQVLGIRLPVIVFIMKNLNKLVTIDIQVCQVVTIDLPVWQLVNIDRGLRRYARWLPSIYRYPCINLFSWCIRTHSCDLSDVHDYSD